MSLKTDFKDAIPASGAGTLRKYQQINNADGTVSFQDVTEYSQAGDKAQASVFNAICDAISKGAIIPLACTKSGTVYALTGLTATSGKVPVMFSVPTAYAAGDTVTIDGIAYTLKTTDGSALTAGAWAVGIVTGTVDLDAKTLTVPPSAPAGSVNKSGDTMTGQLTIKDAITIFMDTAGATNDGVFLLRNGYGAYLMAQRKSDGKVAGLQIGNDGDITLYPLGNTDNGIVFMDTYGRKYADFASGTVPPTAPGLRNILIIGKSDSVPTGLADNTIVMRKLS